jgi:REP element-mobilizing transposase RayT
MSTRKTAFVLEENYHIYNRGNSKQNIFLDEKDYQRFVDLLYAINREEKFNFSDSLKGVPVYNKSSKNQLVAIGAYCLMPNHFHILITPLSENGISKFMQKLSTAYVMYFNQKYKRTGALFEGKFKSQYIGNDKYLKYIYSYIHLNPVKLIQKNWKENGIKNKKETIKYLSEYKYSSFIDYLDTKRPQNIIINKNKFPDYFSNKNDILNEIFVWISFEPTL